MKKSRRPRVRRMFIIPKDIRVVISAPSLDAVFAGYRHLIKAGRIKTIPARDRMRFIKELNDAI